MCVGLQLKKHICGDLPRIFAQTEEEGGAGCIMEQTDVFVFKVLWGRVKILREMCFAPIICYEQIFLSLCEQKRLWQSCQLLMCHYLSSFRYNIVI